MSTSKTTTFDHYNDEGDDAEFYGLTDSEEEARLFYHILDSLPQVSARKAEVTTDGLDSTAQRTLTGALSETPHSLFDDAVVKTIQSESFAESGHDKITREDVLTYESERSAIGRSPYDRFRSTHKKLSVTDLVGPAWCEVQFQYELEKGGKRRRTKAMKIGHEVHSTLEKEVHSTVVFELDNEIPEEKFGLRLLNLLTGLAELEYGGMTRELPVFGFLNETLVNGVIDQIKVDKSAVPSNEQKALATFLKRKMAIKSGSLILSDHKTRVSRSQPPSSQVDQTKLQLMIYRKLFLEMGSLDLKTILARDSLAADRPFSDNFLSKAIQNLGATSEREISDMITHNNIAGLWSLLQVKLRMIGPQLSTTMLINYIHQGSGEQIISKSFQHDLAWMQERLSSIMAWWNGKRDARGVPIEEAHKCSICQFELGCTWRLTKIQEGIEKHRSQNRSSRKSASPS